MANEHGADPEVPEAAGDPCDKCSVPLPEPRRVYCNLGVGCCEDCFAECEAAGRCAKVSDPAVWAKIEHLRRVVRGRDGSRGKA